MTAVVPRPEAPDLQAGAAHGGAGEPPPSRFRRLRRRPSGPVVLLALIAYVPLLFTAQGKVGADTKAYLYLDPGEMLRRAVSLWDPQVGMGTVTHQNIGYLIPSGPWYWFFETIGAPTWVAQRLWTGSLIFAAGTGVLFLLSGLRFRRWPAFVAAFAYALSPYLLEYEARTSVILLPWAGLGWLIGIAVRALREPGSWRWPARFALVVVLIGGINATALIYAGLAPILWVPFAIHGLRETTWRAALKVAGKTLLLTVPANLWWISGLYTQSGYGLDVLQYTETVQTVATTSHPGEIIRGLGNWYFYGRDRVNSWVQTSTRYMTNLPIVSVSFLVPLGALLSAALLRWRLRAYFVALIALGVAISVGVYPYTDPSPAGGLFKEIANSSTAGLALRSTPRATPLVALGLAVLLAAGLTALWDRRRVAVRSRVPAARRARWLAPAATAVALGLIAADMTPLWTGDLVDSSLQAPENVPAYWKQAASAMGAQGNATRVLELPGADFSYYRWGTTADPVTPGLMNRPFVGRELTPYGTAGSAALLRAVDRRLQQGVFETSSLAEIAKLMGVGTVDLRSDLQYERFRTPQPVSTWQLFSKPIAGLSAPTGYGPPVQENTLVPLLNEIELANPANAAHPPAVATFQVKDPEPIVRAERVAQPLLVDGDAEGLVDASAAGILDDSGTVLFAASQTAAQLKAALGDNADILVTDSNRRRAESWGTLRDNYGYTEQAGEKALVEDPRDARLPVFPDETDADRTVAEQRGVTSVVATGYGNPVSYVPADRPAMALDGDLTTAWRVGAFDDVRGEKLDIDLGTPTRTNSITLVQPVTGQRNRYLTRVGVRINGGPERSVDLGPQSRVEGGQQVTFPTQDVRTVQIVLHDTNFGIQSEYTGASGVGFAEVRIGDRHLDEMLRLPTAILSAAGTSSLSHRLTMQFTRDRADPADAVAEDAELAMERTFTLPTARTFSVDGTARVSAAASDPLIDRTVGRAGDVTFDSSVRLPGLLTARASSAFDGDTGTSWTTIFDKPAGQWVQATSPTPVTFDHLDLSVVADGRHSVPASVDLVVDGKKARHLELPPIYDAKGNQATRSVRLAFPTVTGKNIRLVISSVREEKTIDYFSQRPYDLPAAVAEVGIPGLRAGAEPAQLPSACRGDLLTVDGKKLSVRVTGATKDAEGRLGLTVTGCGAPVTLAAGQHVLRTGEGRFKGLDIDRLELSSAAGGGAVALTATGEPATDGTSRTAAAPAVAVRSQSSTSYDLRVTDARPGTPFWLVLGQSLSAGWQAKVGGRTLAAPQLVDGYANGWRVTPTAGSFDVTLTWTPQRVVWVALGISAVALLIVLALAFAPWGWWRSRRRRDTAPIADGSDTAAAAAVPDADAWRPALEAPWAVVGARPSPATTAGTVLAAGLIAGVAVSLLGGLLTAAATAIALLVPRGRLVLRGGAVACFAYAAARVLWAQYRYDLAADFQWAQAFRKTVLPAWLAITLLVADVLVVMARRRAARPPAEPAPGPAPTAAPEPPPA